MSVENGIKLLPVEIPEESSSEDNKLQVIADMQNYFEGDFVKTLSGDYYIITQITRLPAEDFYPKHPVILTLAQLKPCSGNPDEALDMADMAAAYALGSSYFPFTRKI